MIKLQEYLSWHSTDQTSMPAQPWKASFLIANEWGHQMKDAKWR